MPSVRLARAGFRPSGGCAEVLGQRRLGRRRPSLHRLPRSFYPLDVPLCEFFFTTIDFFFASYFDLKGSTKNVTEEEVS